MRLIDEIHSKKLPIEIMAQEAAAQKRANEIAAAQRLLESTDYKIAKCTEYSLNGLLLPYDIAELHAERQACRDIINAGGG
jgi:hypothetical protein